MKNSIIKDKPLFIAEISANHNGSIKNAKKLIKDAKKNGADFVKLQTYTPDTMTLKSNKKDFEDDGGWIEDEDDFEQLMRDMDKEAEQMMDVLGLGMDDSNDFQQGTFFSDGGRSSSSSSLDMRSDAMSFGGLELDHSSSNPANNSANGNTNFGFNNQSFSLPTIGHGHGHGAFPPSPQIQRSPLFEPSVPAQVPPSFSMPQQPLPSSPGLDYAQAARKTSASTSRPKVQAPSQSYAGAIRLSNSKTKTGGPSSGTPLRAPKGVKHVPFVVVVVGVEADLDLEGLVGLDDGDNVVFPVRVAVEVGVDRGAVDGGPAPAHNGILELDSVVPLAA